MKKVIKKIFNPTIDKIDVLGLQAKLNMAFARAAASFSTRIVDDALPQTWESSGFSQNGEDGIIDHLISKLKHSNKYFVEIGSNNGIENNSSYLAHIKKFSGLQIEGDTHIYNEALKTKAWLADCYNCFVKESTVNDIIQRCLFMDPDVFSIDIDGMDYYITKLLFEKKLRPKIIVVEYNSAFGPEKKLTLDYAENFSMFNTGFPFLYYGVSINGWKHFFSMHGYEFVTVESNGVNAFFIDPKQFPDGFTSKINSIDFKENKHQLRYFKCDWTFQFEKIRDQAFFELG